MPVLDGIDANGKFVQWGHHGHKYYYLDDEDRPLAVKKAMRQAMAIAAAKKRYAKKR